MLNDGVRSTEPPDLLAPETSRPGQSFGPPGTVLGYASGGPALSLPADLLVDDLLERAAANRRAELIFPVGESEERVSFAELLRRARTTAAGLVERGVGPGARVGILLPTSPEFVTSFFGILLAGAAPVVLPPPIPFGRLGSATNQLRQIAQRAALECAVVAEGFAGLAAEAGIARSVAPAALLSGTERAYRPRRVDAEAPALIQFTSGSTLAPRGAVLSHRALISEVAAIADASGAGTADVVCCWLPLYHDLGLIGCLLFSVYVGGPLVLLRTEQFLANPLGWLAAIDRYRVTLSPAPNFAYALVAARLARQRLSGVDLSCWRIAYNGGEPVDPSTLDAFAEALAPHGFTRSALWPSYGLAEASLAVSLPRPARPPRTLTVDRVALGEARVVRPLEPGAVGGKRLVSVGTPLRGISVAIVDEGPPDRERAVGQVYVAGPTLMSGYFNDPVETARALGGGWLATGDLGFLHDGELFITGRSKDLIIVRGRNFYPQDIEHVVNRITGIRSGTAVAAARDGTGGELLVFAEARPTEAAALDAIAAAVEAEVAAEFGLRPAVVGLLPRLTLPKTTSGKLQRQRTVALFEAGQLRLLHRGGTSVRAVHVDVA